MSGAQTKQQSQHCILMKNIAETISISNSYEMINEKNFFTFTGWKMVKDAVLLKDCRWCNVNI